MQELDLSGLREWTDKLDKVLKEFPDMRRQAHEELGDELKKLVGANVRATVEHNPGEVISWQEKYVGSGGGYAAIRARTGAHPTKGENYGALDNYVDGGHAVRKPSGTSSRYRSRKIYSRVEGKDYYAQARATASAVAIQAAERLVEKMKRMLDE